MASVSCSVTDAFKASLLSNRRLVKTTCAKGLNTTAGTRVRRQVLQNCIVKGAKRSPYVAFITIQGRLF
eukprot:6200831-Pleurochrysis_carterae.AAC.2